jgi:hypothetical protein
MDDGSRWREPLVLPADLAAVTGPSRNAMNACTFVAVIALSIFSGSGWVSAADPWNWMRPTVAPTQDNLSAVACGNGQFVAVGSQTIIASSDGVNVTQDHPL